MKTPHSSQLLLHSPEAMLTLQRGFDKLATPLASTLGPSQRLVMNAVSKLSVEFLADTGTIAQRFLELKAPGENVGAMLLRAMVLQMHKTHGDGAATATVLARAMLREGTRLLAAGLNPALLRHGIERGVKLASAALQKQAVPVEGQEMYTQLATGMTGDPTLGAILGEMLDIMGEHAAFVVNDHELPRVEHEYASGGRWVAIPGDRTLIPQGNGGLELHAPLILLVNEHLKTLEQVQPALELAASLGDKAPLLVVTRDISESARDALVLNHVRGVLNVGVALLRSSTFAVADDLEDIAVLTGARVLSEETGYPPQRMQYAYFGRARKATITNNMLMIVDGHGDQNAVRARIAEVRKRLHADTDRGTEWDRLRVRIGRLSGGVGVIKVGGYSEHEREIRKELVNKALRSIESAHADGVVGGGGVAYLECIPLLEAEQQNCLDRDEAAGISMVAKALEAPFLQIISNHGGIYPPLALAEVQRLGKGYGFDALQGDYTCMLERGVIDSVKVARGALEAAASLAAMAVTTDTIITL